MGRHDLIPVPPPFAHNKCRRQCCRTRAQMNDQPSGKVERAERSDPPPDTPDPVRNRTIDKCGPQKKEYQVGLEFEPLGERAGDQRRCDDCKHHLKNHVRLMRNRCCILGVGLDPDSRKPRPRERSDESPHIRPECQTVADKNPLNRHHPECDETLHDRSQHILPSHHAPVEQRQSRRHEHHQRRGNQDPGRVPAVDPCSVLRPDTNAHNRKQSQHKSESFHAITPSEFIIHHSTFNIGHSTLPLSLERIFPRFFRPYTDHLVDR